MSKILITGAGGMLGGSLVDFFSQDPEKLIFGTYLNSLIVPERVNVAKIKVDLTNISELSNLLITVKPDIIIHCAADVNIEAIEENIENAMYLHAEIIREFKMFSPGSLLVYISTDSVHNGNAALYGEKSIPDPINNYAFTKVIGESIAVDQFSEYIIIRTNIFGRHTTKDRTSLAEWAIRNLTMGKVINGFDDILFNPLHTKQLAEVLNDLLIHKVRGIVNVVSDEVVSKYDFLVLLAEKFKLSKELIIKSKSTLMKSKVKKPLNTTLSNLLMTEYLGRKISIIHGIQNLYDEYQKKD